jgi:glucuronoarabinoxylan endo-1,4-beta-xylanase
MRAHWAFVGTGESQYNPGNTKNTLLPRAYVMSHFSKHLPGATRLDTNPRMTEGEQKKLEYSAYIKGDSLIVMAINKFDKSYDLNIVLPSEVKSGKLIVSTSNTSLCQESPIALDEPTSSVMVTMGPQSLNTWIFMINKGETAINHQTRAWNGGATEYYDLRGRRLSAPGGLCVERHSDGSSRVVFIGR